jgi:uncharacterized protein (DUF1015 family)
MRCYQQKAKKTMRIEPFKLISFKQSYWEDSHFTEFLTNTNIVGKAQKTVSIIEFLKHKISNGEATIDSNPGIYILNIKSQNKDITFMICVLDYNEKEAIFPNENIHEDKLVVYRDLLNKHKLQTNPVLTFYKAGKLIKDITRNMTTKNPNIRANINDAQYSLWKIQDYQSILAIKSNISVINKVYIADGHHRFSLFQKVANKTNAKIMIALTDSESISIGSCHRAIIGDVNPNWMQNISNYCSVEKSNNFSIENITIIQNNGDIYKIKLNNTDFQIYNVVEQVIIQNGLEISDKTRILPLPGSFQPQDYKKIFDLYKNSTMLIFVPKLTICDFFKVVDNVKKLPPSSTWFEPKIIDGFFMKTFG